MQKNTARLGRVGSAAGALSAALVGRLTSGARRDAKIVVLAVPFTEGRFLELGIE
jgi:hypothetical protein